MFDVNELYIPKSSTEWHNWLANEESKTLDSYLAKPANLIKEFRSERAISEDYRGREILELLQNAADQAKESQVKGQVVIELMNDCLIVANTGKAFSVGGIHSLQNQHISPKRRRQRKLIGCKGLGFRSILNLTKKPLISSGELNIAYSEAYSKSLLKNICRESKELELLVSREQEHEKDLIFPILPFPVFGNAFEQLAEDILHTLKERSQYWRSAGYDTVIGIPFDDVKYKEIIKKQIEALKPETLLFVPFLDEVTFILPEQPSRVWTKEGSDKTALVMENDVPIGIWQIFREHGYVTPKYLEKTGEPEFR